MIRAALQRPGRLRMRLTVVAAASAVFALIVLAVLVKPLQRNLEQSRVDSLRASVLATDPAQLVSPSAQPPSTAQLQGLAGTLGVSRVTVFAVGSFTVADIADSSSQPIDGALAIVEESASLRGDITTVKSLSGARTAVLTFFVSNNGMDGVVLVEAPLSDVQQQVSAVERRLVIGGLLAFAVALVAGALAAEPLARRLARLRAAADRIAHGSFEGPSVDHSLDEIGDLARSLEDMRARLEALERSRATFIANASHELRTPLTALGGYLELLAEGGLTEAERTEFIDTMAEQVQRLTKLATTCWTSPASTPEASPSRTTRSSSARSPATARARCRRSRRAAALPSSRRPGSRLSHAATRAACCRSCACWSTTRCATRRPEPL